MRYTSAYSVVIFLELAALLRHASLESPSYRERCPRPHIKNGWVKLRSRGRIAKFNCIREFQLLGEKFATCLDGEWDNPAPLCVKPGCDVLSLSNGQVMATYRGAVVTFFCNPGYTLQGIAKLYCDGKSWNGTAPQCIAISNKPVLSCDFEGEDLCGWTQDPHHHFNWTRLNHNTPSGSVGTGPSHDHTYGKGKDGYYLYIETSGPRKQNDTARLYSPVYSPDVVALQPSCFIFWYHMYGATVGSLAVYIKPDNLELTSDLEAGFFQSGNKGDVWLKGVVSIPPIGVPFQIIIEGVRGPGYVGDTAIDDVRLTNGSDCEEFTTDVALGSVYVTNIVSLEGEITTDFITDAAVARSTKLSRIFPTPPPLPPLEPHPLENFTLDLPSTVTKTAVTQTLSTTEDIFRPIPIPPDPTPLILNLPLPTFESTRAMPNSTTEISTTTSASTLRTLTTKSRSTRLPVTSTTTVGKTSTPVVAAAETAAAATTTTAAAAATTTPKTTTTTITTATAAASSTSTTIKETAAAATTTTTTTTKRTTTTMHARPSVRKSTIMLYTRPISTKVIPILMSTISTSTTSVPSERGIVNIIADNVTTSKPYITTQNSTRKTYTTASVTTIKTKSSSWNNIFAPSTRRTFLKDDTQGTDWKAAPRGTLMQSEEPLPISLIAGITILIATVAVVSVVVSIFIRQRRKSRSQQNLAEDSDVRFLTADEVLDFTLARPREDEDF